MKTSERTPEQLSDLTQDDLTALLAERGALYATLERVREILGATPKSAFACAQMCALPSPHSRPPSPSRRPAKSAIVPSTGGGSSSACGGSATSPRKSGMNAGRGAVSSPSCSSARGRTAPTP